MTIYEYGVEFTQFDEYEAREISERTTLYFDYIPEVSDILGSLDEHGYNVCQILDCVMLREIRD